MLLRICQVRKNRMACELSALLADGFSLRLFTKITGSRQINCDAVQSNANEHMYMRC